MLSGNFPRRAGAGVALFVCVGQLEVALGTGALDLWMVF